MPSNNKPVWPMGQIPVEIFALITRHLPRASLQAMRLVCREFEHKVSAEYFRHVVVTFHPELYSSSEDLCQVPGEQASRQVTPEDERRQVALTDGAHPTSRGGSNLQLAGTERGLATPLEAAEGQDKLHGGSRSNADGKVKKENAHLLANGMRIFREFGDHMRGFALVLEVSEAELAFPPIKCTQTAVTSFWGIYRWPEQEYQRYGHLEYAEDLADETGRLTVAFSHLKDVQELALSCDAGLGFLRGPDVHSQFPLRLASVLKSSDYPPGPAPTIEDVQRKNALPLDEGKTPLYMLLKQMLMGEGYEEHQVAEAIEILMENEFSRLGHLNAKNVTITQADAEEISPAILAEIIRQKQGKDPALAEIGLTASHCLLPAKPLLPAYLTRSQLEMLLELGWAQRALVQSYIITVMDTARAGKLQNLRALTISRIAASHVVDLARPEFWKTLTSVESVSIGVIPDWRKLEKRTRFTHVTEHKVLPSRACPSVFQLLQTCGTHSPTMTSLHFEWVGGGELASGVSQRDRYTMPAPFFADPAVMLGPRPTTKMSETLWLPRLSHLSLKNCWFTPHAFLQIFRNMANRGALRSLALESISLTAPADFRTSQPSIKVGANNVLMHWPWPLCAGVLPGRQYILTRRQGQIAAAQQPLVAAGGDMPAGLNYQAALVWLQNHAAGALQQNQQQQQAVPDLQQQVAHMAHVAYHAHMQLLLQQQQQHQPLDQQAQPASLEQTAGRPGPSPLVPDLFTWAHVLNELTPSLTIQEAVDGLEDSDPTAEAFTQLREKMQLYLSFSGDRPAARKLGKLHRIDLRSCGYVLVDVPQLSNWDIIPRVTSVAPQTEETARRLRELDEMMQTTADPMLGTILNYMHGKEQTILQTVFGMRLGWQNGVYDAEVAREAHLDGNPVAGTGRFTGHCVRGERAVSVFPSAASGDGRADAGGVGD